ncbi:MAG: 4-amino-4-deoxychorismate lyase [Actinobacteria bacterium]|nr:4-amino-4-deoxychorismate lyase [Actinomycetota bacterium]
MKLSVNARLVDSADAQISPFDHGLLVGDGVFETLRVYDGVPFAWTRHLDRLEHSGRGLGLTIPDRSGLREAADAVLDANGTRDGRLRITVTAGPAPLGSERGDAPPTVIVAVNELKAWSATETVASVPWPRNERGATAGLKTISYAENVRALALAIGQGAHEAIFANTRGELCEATGSNVFVVSDGIACTPPADSGCLLGVTRALVLELAATHDVPATERVLSLEDLRNADEAFLTSTTREVHAIAKVDDHELANAPGPVTNRLADEFKKLVAANPDP